VPAAAAAPSAVSALQSAVLATVCDELKAETQRLLNRKSWSEYSAVSYAATDVAHLVVPSSADAYLFELVDVVRAIRCVIVA